MTASKHTWQDVLDRCALLKLQFLNVPDDLQDNIHTTKKPGVWHFRCRCGKEFSPKLKSIMKSNHPLKSCGCQKSSPTRPGRAKHTWRDVLEVCEQRGWKLLHQPINFDEKVSLTHAKGLYKFKCRCGEEFSPAINWMMNPNRKSCGCHHYSAEYRERARQTTLEQKRKGLPNPANAKYTWQNVQDKCNELGMRLLNPPKDLDAKLYPTKLTDSWGFQCRCGRKFEPRIGSILMDNTTTCGCIKSKPQIEILATVQAMGLKPYMNDRQIIAPLELDVYIPEKKLAIEYCGLHWHGELRNGKAARKKHLNKLLACRAAGIRLVTIFEDEWLSNRAAVEGFLSSMLGQKVVRLQARKLGVTRLEPEEAKGFLEEYHLQGAANGQHWGLRTKDRNLVAVATFASPNASRASKKGGGVIELARYCLGPKVSVAGGLGRLLAGYVEANPEVRSIVSFSDNRWSEGKVYEALGFEKVAETSPSYWYFKASTKGPRHHRYGFRKQRAAKLFGCAPGETEWKIMQRAGYDRIWDCGNAKWVLNINKSNKL